MVWPTQRRKKLSKAVDAAKNVSRRRPHGLYSELEVETDATVAQIVKAHRKKMLQHHPDKLGVGASPQKRAAATVKCQQLNLAKEVLTDPVLRARYDAEHPWAKKVERVDVTERVRLHRLNQTTMERKAERSKDIARRRGGLKKQSRTKSNKVILHPYPAGTAPFYRFCHGQIHDCDEVRVGQAVRYVAANRIAWGWQTGKVVSVDSINSRNQFVAGGEAWIVIRRDPVWVRRDRRLRSVVSLPLHLIRLCT